MSIWRWGLHEGLVSHLTKHVHCPFAHESPSTMDRGSIQKMVRTYGFSGVGRMATMKLQKI